jgi:GNAT superfamily N-acetyltransferase
VSAILRPGTIADISAIADLHARSWRKTYRGLFSDAFLDGPVFAEREAMWTKRLNGWDTARNVVLLSENGGRLEGFASVMLDTEPAWGARLDNLHVDPDGKGRGTGRLLMRAAATWVLAENKAPMLHLMVFEGNVPAREFYDAMRGERVERREATVEDGTRLFELRYVWRDLNALAGGD